MIKPFRCNCVTYRRLYMSPANQRMADLPYGSAFKSVGVNIFRPFYVKVGRAQAKCYEYIFSCFTNCAIHIEKLDTIDTDALINGLVRFSLRRDYYDNLTSDKVTNLLGAH